MNAGRAGKRKIILIDFNFESGLEELIKNNQKYPKRLTLFFRYHGVTIGKDYWLI